MEGDHFLSDTIMSFIITYVVIRATMILFQLLPEDLNLKTFPSGNQNETQMNLEFQELNYINKNRGNILITLCVCQIIDLMLFLLMRNFLSFFILRFYFFPFLLVAENVIPKISWQR